MRWDYLPLDINPVFSGLGELLLLLLLLLLLFLLLLFTKRISFYYELASYEY